MKIIFMGTPDFAVPALQALIDAPEHEVSLVVTQPDRRKGRSDKLIASPVKECAVTHEIPVFQPERIKTPEAVERLRAENADVIVVAAFGQILSKEILELPRYGCMNIHGSLLPGYRGAAPIQWAVIDGLTESGNTIMQMNEGLDTGDILLQERVTLDPRETAESLYEKLSQLGGPMICKALAMAEAGTLTPIPQDESKASYAKILRKEMGRIDWTRPAAALDSFVRGMNSWPSAYTTLHGKTLKIWDAVAVPETTAAAPGTIVAVTKDAMDVATGDGLLRLFEVQLEGKKRMSVHDFLLGMKIEVGEQLNV